MAVFRKNPPRPTAVCPLSSGGFARGRPIAAAGWVYTAGSFLGRHYRGRCSRRKVRRMSGRSRRIALDLYDPHVGIPRAFAV